MLEIIGDIIEAEKEAESRVAEARREAQERESAQEAKDRTRLQEARSAADARVLDDLARHRREEEAAYEERVAAARKGASDFLEAGAAELDRAVAEAVRIVETTSTRT